jgi:flavin reductase (DIM6/NTAB) family NADH-FMN oxidoreductase RutF
MPVESEIFRDVLTNFPSGVAIVTAFDEDRKPYGLTVSAFCAVSMDPPLVLVCIDRASNTLPAMQAAEAFTVNLLAAGRDELALRFATKGDDKFSDLAWEDPSLAQAGPVLVGDSVAYAVCTTHSEFEAGDHLIVVGLVEDAASDHEAAPLVYARRRFGTWDPSEIAPPETG